MFIVLLLFGADKLPGLAKGIASPFANSRSCQRRGEEVRRAMEQPDEPPPKKIPTQLPPAGTIQQAAPDKPAPPPVAEQ